MKIQLIYAVSLITIMLTSCQKETITFSEVEPETPASFSIDLDDDGTDDFEIYYGPHIYWASDRDWGKGGYLHAIGENQVLRKEDKSILFLRNPEEIQLDVKPPYIWEDYGFNRMIEIDHYFDGGWPSEWTIMSDKTYPTYGIGLKLASSQKVGWIELKLNKKTGEITLLSKEIL